MIATECPTADELVALVMGVLSGDELEHIAAHLDCCPSCLAEAERIRPGDTRVAALCRETSSSPWTREAAALRYVEVRLHAAGGLGEVHIAEDTELNRQVALKRIRTARADDPESRRRFMREAEITARLEHPGVVPVYGLIRDAEGRPHFAMRFVDGESLYHAIRTFHEADGPDRDPSERRLSLRGLLTRFVAVCQTIAYAHSRGIVHRDLKPANVMLGQYGETLVVDWGLAKQVQSADWNAQDSNGSMTHADFRLLHSLETVDGLQVGTPSYMSPEQTAGRNADVGPASDVFGLGATLYAILTGGPPTERQTSSSATRVPAALHAICLKAMAENPNDRYASASEVGAEVDRWLAGEPVKAHPDRWPARAARWARCHRVAVAGLATGLLVAAIFAGSGGMWVAREADDRRAEQARLAATDAEAIDRALTELPGLVRTWRFAEARRLLDQTSAGWSEFARPEDRERLEHGRWQIGLAARLDAIRLDKSKVVGGNWNTESAAPAYWNTFARHGMDCASSEIDGVVQAIAASPIREALLIALDDWANEESNDQLRERLMRIARAADPDAWRDQYRTALANRDGAKLRELTKQADVERLAPTQVVSLAREFGDQSPDAQRLLRRALSHHPSDYWLNLHFGHAINRKNDRLAAAQAAGYFRVATVARPDASIAFLNLGGALVTVGDLAGASAAFGRASELDPTHAATHSNFGNTLFDLGDRSRAEAEFRRALELDPTVAVAHCGIASILLDRGELDAAEKSLRKSVDLDPNYAYGHGRIGLLMDKRGDPAGAEAAYRRAVEIDPNLTWAHINLGNVYRRRGNLEGAIGSYRRAIAADPSSALANLNLGIALRDQGDLVAAEATLRRAIELAPDLAAGHNNLGNVLRERGDNTGAVKSLRRALELDPSLLAARINLGNVLRERREFGEAETLLKRATEMAPNLSKAHFNYGLLLLDRGDQKAAESAFRRAVDLAPNDAEAHDGLGLALAARDDLSGAVSAFRKSIALNPRMVPAHLNLADALLGLGRFDDALLAARRGLDAYPTGRPGRDRAVARVRRCERIIELGGKLTAVVRGDSQPTDLAERLDLAELAALTRQFAAATRLYQDLFRRDPSTEAQHRFNAARAAARAGCGQGAMSVTDDERLRWRHQALDWLQSELKQLVAANGNLKELARQRLGQMQTERDFHGLRDEAALCTLPTEERASWCHFWADVAAALTTQTK